MQIRTRARRQRTGRNERSDYVLNFWMKHERPWTGLNVLQVALMARQCSHAGQHAGHLRLKPGAAANGALKHIGDRRSRCQILKEVSLRHL